MRKTLIVVIIIAVIVVAGAFYGGMKYGQSKNFSSNNFAQKFGQAGQNGVKANFQGRNGQGMAGAVNGEILSLDDKSITVKLRDGGSKIVFFGDKTTVAKTVDGALADLNIGEQVVVMGQANSDGSVTAQSIQIRSAVQIEQGNQPKTDTPASVPTTK